MEAAVGGRGSSIVAKQPAVEVGGFETVGSRESQAQRSVTEPGAFDQRVKKRDELGLIGSGRLMEQQKQAVIELVASHRSQGRRVGEVLGGVGVARSSYYRWKKNEPEKKNASDRIRTRSRPRNENLLRRSRAKSAVSPSAHPRGLAAAGNLSFGFGDLRAFKRAGADRAV